jgi:hypothetical protein
MDTRKIAGDIVREEVARKGESQVRAAEAMHIARPTLARFLAGDPTVSDITLRQIEGHLLMPRRFLSMVIAADRAGIEGITDLDSDLRRLTLGLLSDPDGKVASKRRRA